MEFRNDLQKDGKDNYRDFDVSKRVKIIFGVIMGIVVLSILLFVFFAPTDQEYKEQHFDEYFDKLIDKEETAIVENAFDRSEVLQIEDAREHLRLLFSVLWLHRDEEDIDIVSAEIVEFSNADVEGVGKLYDGYALRVVLASGDTYTVFRNSYFERVLKNDSEEIWIAHTADTMLP